MTAYWYIAYPDNFREVRVLYRKMNDFELKCEKRHNSELDKWRKKVDEWSDKKAGAKAFPDLYEWEWMTKEEFAKYYKLMVGYMVAKESEGNEQTQLMIYHSEWLLQWILNRRKKTLRNPSVNRVGTKESWFVLDESDLKDLIKRLNKVIEHNGNIVKGFPVYKNLYYGDLRCCKYTKEAEEHGKYNQEIMFKFRNNLEFTMENILTETRNRFSRLIIWFD